jgi:hypothetical protein
MLSEQDLKRMMTRHYRPIESNAHTKQNHASHILWCVFIFKNPIVQGHQRRGVAGEGAVPYYFESFYFNMTIDWYTGIGDPLGHQACWL